MLKAWLPLLVLLAASTFLSAQAVGQSLGSKDFYPSVEQPVGFRGDGNGWFPGATPVSDWREGTVGRNPDSDELIATDRNEHNVVWKAEMPSWANSQPIVVGDRVFTTAEPNLLVCVDANSGRILWTTAANPWKLLGVEPAAADRVQSMYDLWREVIPRFGNMCHDTTICRVVPSRQFDPIATTFVESVLPRVIKELSSLDPDGDYKQAALVTQDALRRYSMALSTWESDGAATGAPVEKHDPVKNQICRLADYVAERMNLIAGYRGSGRGRVPLVPLSVQWEHITGLATAAPVSDGRYVYASFGQGQTICCDLNGKQIWGAAFPMELDKQNLTTLHAPLLAGGVLVDMHGGAETLRGLDKQTGRVLWEAPTKGRGARDAGGYDVGSHKIVGLNRDGHPEDFVVTTLCNIIRARDGRVVGSLPFNFPAFGGPSIVSNGDVVLKGAVGDNYRAPLVAWRLRIVGEDQVEAQEVWRTRRKSTPGYQSIVMSPAAVFMSSTEHTALAPLTGEILSHDSPTPIGGFSNIVAGNCWIWADDGSKHWADRDDEVFGSFGVADVTDPGGIKLLSDNNVLGGPNIPRMPAMEKFASELHALKFYAGKTYGRPAHFLHADSTIFPSGNRLFIRSVSHLYSIGDPSAPYNWNPASRPAAISSELLNN